MTHIIGLVLRIASEKLQSVAFFFNRFIVCVIKLLENNVHICMRTSEVSIDLLSKILRIVLQTGLTYTNIRITMEV